MDKKRPCQRGMDSLWNDISDIERSMEMETASDKITDEEVR